MISKLDLLKDFVMRKLDELPEEEIIRRLTVLNIGVPTEDLNSLICKECGLPMTQNGSCYKCGNCGWTSGCS